ncbi:hypothetical protein BDF20DRAFT_838950 [Mycotypha africana]|uniref:uncharacterized protein n=1 Tax=Mycotypha africana TaxID=64632 RepID=UPI002300162E|nr:uncharacterized protein BDF20DRAFT_838950 [Mycotypha africana]KAI8968971.1 hypothetical protein BDF20DRAFT_838950 [Mycotypha africana]
MNSDQTASLNRKRSTELNSPEMSKQFIDQKRLKENESTAEGPKLTAKQKKKATRARKLGLPYAIKEEDVIVYPKIFFKQFNDFATMKDVRNMMLTALEPKGKQARLAEIPDFPGVTPVRKAIIIDVPILDPTSLQVPINTRYISKATTPDIYQQLKANRLLAQYFQQRPDDDENNIFGIVCAAGFDQYKRVHDRFWDLLEVPLSKGELKKKREEEDKEPDPSKAIHPEALIMTKELLVAEDFPIHSSMDADSVLEDGWVDTLQGKGSETKRLVALDCEMCKTVNGYAVTRVALIDREKKVLINELVKPTEEITDYVTHISGVDEASLKNVKTTLADMQKKLLTFIDSDTILVGHGLVNDLKCLKMRHPFIIDTSVIYHHKNGPPYKPSLRDLTTRYLKRTIQVRDEDKRPGDVKGHDPCEDAIASLELLERKLRYGLSYGFTGLSQVETILDYLHRANQHGAVIEHNADLSVMMKSKLSENNKDYYCSVDSDEAVAEKTIMLHKDREVIIARFDLPQETEEEKQCFFLKLFEQIYHNMEDNTAYCITTGNRKDKKREGLRDKRVTYKKRLKRDGLQDIPMGDRWTLEDEEELMNISEATRRGLVFASVKTPVV